MGEILQLDYYYGIEAEQFSFYRVPRLLIKDERFKKLSSDAKLLYGLMLDRMSLSMKNEWFDNENRASGSWRSLPEEAISPSLNMTSKKRMTKMVIRFGIVNAL